MNSNTKNLLVGAGIGGAAGAIYTMMKKVKGKKAYMIVGGVALAGLAVAAILGPSMTLTMTVPPSATTPTKITTNV